MRKRAGINLSRKACFRLVLLFFTLASIELTLWGAALTLPDAATLLSAGHELALPDERLGQRPNPQVPDHDAAGWRNERVLAQADIVAIGDSQTYGAETARVNAWPQQLGTELGVPVYNMALGGYGPAAYYLLGPEALEKRPKLLLVGIYAGNDLADAYTEVLLGRAPELRDGAPLSITELTAIDLERGSIGRYWEQTRAARKGRVGVFLEEYIEPALGKSRLVRLIQSLARIRFGATSGLQPDSNRSNFAKYAKKVAGVSPDLFLPLTGAKVETILTPAGRHATMNTGDPRIAEGARITLMVLERLQHMCRKQCRVLVVMIPTKELVFAQQLSADDIAMPRLMTELIENETQFWRHLRRDLDRRGIANVEVLRALRANVAAGENPYLSDWNGHPGVLGNSVIAKAVAEHPLVKTLVQPRTNRDP